MSVNGPQRVGQLSTEWMEATRQKYGRCPAPANAEPLPGHEEDVIPHLPDYYNMKESEFNRLALNRADERRRLVPSLTRRLRLMTYSRQRNRGFQTDVHGET